MFCRICEEEVRSFDDGICKMCQIGDKSPSKWILGEIKKKLEQEPPIWAKNNTRKHAYESLSYDLDKGYCNDCYTDTPNRRVTISISASGNKDLSNIEIVFKRWCDNGNTSYKPDGPYKISNVDTFVEEALPLFMNSLIDLINFADQGLYCCSNCGKVFEEISGRHFAGIYCESCWEKYKNKHSGTCHRCKDPRWRCVC